MKTHIIRSMTRGVPLCVALHIKYSPPRLFIFFSSSLFFIPTPLMLYRFFFYSHFFFFAEPYFSLDSLFYSLFLLCAALFNRTAFNGIASGGIVLFFPSELLFLFEILSYRSEYSVVQGSRYYRHWLCGFVSTMFSLWWPQVLIIPTQAYFRIAEKRRLGRGFYRLINFPNDAEKGEQRDR